MRGKLSRGARHQTARTGLAATQVEAHSTVYAVPMLFRTFLVVGATAWALMLSGCQAPGPVAEPPAAPVTTPTERPAGQDEETATFPLFAEACNTWDTEQLEWRELASATVSSVSGGEDREIALTSTPLPPGPAGRYNAAIEVCPGFLWILSHEGTSRFISLDTAVWAEGPTLATRGETGSISTRGAASGGPAWGFRDALAVGNSVYLSDAVLDATNECVRLDVHHIDTATLLTPNPQARIVYASDPCVSYQDDWRPSAPLKIHFGGALAFSEQHDELFVSIGDFHIAASAIGQADAVGQEGLTADYSLVLDPDAAITAVVAISSPATTATSRIFAKGLRNSLGMTHSLDGDLWLSDHGPRGGDEINLITEGANYGWPLASEGQPYDRSQWPAEVSWLPDPWLSFTTHDVPGITAPEFTWTPAQAPGELVLYNPEEVMFPEFQGTMLMGTLRGEALIRLSRDSAGVITEFRIPLGERIRDLTVTTRGEIIGLTDSSRLLVLTKKENP